MDPKDKPPRNLPIGGVPVPAYGMPPMPMPMPPPPQPPDASAVPLPLYGMPPTAGVGRYDPQPPTAPYFPIPAAPRSTLGERIGGGVALLFGLLIFGINGVLLVTSSQFYPKIMIVAPPLCWSGLWVLMFAKPKNPETGMPPLWWLAGLLIGLLIALAVGIALAFGLSA